MLKILDVWEADVNLDVPTLKAAGVVGMIVRLNDMNGGHHDDEKFSLLWKQAQEFPVQAAYFVYNPWATGLANFQWLKAHLPSEYEDRRIFVDIEVKYEGYSPATYASEVAKFKALIEQWNQWTIYTGEWFLPVLSTWPEGSYWWGRYPSQFYKTELDPVTGTYKLVRESITWEEFDRRVAAYGWNPDPGHKCPGTVDLHQISGDGLIMPGFGGRAVDVNIYPGTLDQLKTFFNVPAGAEPPQEDEPMGMYEGYQRGIMLYETHSLTNADALRGKVDFIVAYAGKGETPADKFRDWCELGKTLSVPVYGYFKPDVVKAIGWTWGGEWPGPDNDFHMQMLYRQTKAVNGTQYQLAGWIVDGSDYLNERDELLPEGWLARVWQHEWNNAFKRFKWEVFPFMKWETINKYPEGGALRVMLATRTILEAVSTYNPAKHPVTVDGWLIPGDTDGVNQPYAPKWDFLQYGAANVPGIAGSVPLFLRNKPRVSQPEPPPDDGDTNPPEDDGNNPPPPAGDVWERIAANLERIADALEAGNQPKSFTVESFTINGK